MTQSVTGKVRETRQYRTNNGMVDLNPNTSVTILNLNELNHPTKRQRLAEWIFKKLLSNFTLSIRNSF